MQHEISSGHLKYCIVFYITGGHPDSQTYSSQCWQFCQKAQVDLLSIADFVKETLKVPNSDKCHKVIFEIFCQLHYEH